MNKTVIFLCFAILAALALAGTVLLLITRPDASATFTAFVVQILGLVTVAAVTFYGLGKANEKLERVEEQGNRVEAQTNGNLSRVQGENERLTNVLIRAGIDPESIQE